MPDNNAITFRNQSKAGRALRIASPIVMVAMFTTMLVVNLIRRPEQTGLLALCALMDLIWLGVLIGVLRLVVRERREKRGQA